MGAAGISSQSLAAVRRSVGQIVNCDFTEACRIADSAATLDPREPLLPYCMLAAIGMRDLDYDAVTDTARFNALYLRAVESTEKNDVRLDSSSHLLTVRGLALATYSAGCLRQKHYGKAVDVGLDALRSFERARRRYPGNGDALFIPGLYDCARGDLKQRLWWVLFWYPGSTRQGMEKLEQCAATALYAGPGARIALIDIYTKEKQSDKAGNLLDALDKEYPASRFIGWARARWCEARGDNIGAAAAYGHLADAYDTIPEAWRSAVTTRNKQAHRLLDAGKPEECAAACRSCLSRCVRHPEAFTREIESDTRRLLEKAGNHGMR
jgi:tetratricopeptide (TPR) repeat protein